MERYTDIIILYVYIKTKLLFHLDFSTEWPLNVQIAAHGTDSLFLRGYDFIYWSLLR